VASACKSLRECERWRGEILREISRKVSKIQDGASPFRFVAFCGLTDSLFVVFCVCVALVVLHLIVTNSRSLGLRSTGRERRYQQAVARKAALGKPNSFPWRREL
jgi:hypothetical protein